MKRILIIIVLIFVFLTAALGSMAALICRSDALHRYILSRVNKSIPGTFTLGRLRISPFNLQVELLDATLADSSGKQVAAFDRLFVDISTKALLQKKIIVEKVILERPQALLAPDSNGVLSLLRAFPQGQKKPQDQTDTTPVSLPRLEVHNLDIIGGSTIFVTEQDSFRVQAYGLSITANGATIPLAVKAEVAFDSVEMYRSGSVTRLRDFFCSAQMNNLAIDTAYLTFRTDNSALTLHGRVSSLTDTPYVAHLAVAADVSLSELRSALVLTNELDGKAQVHVRLDGAVTNPDLDLTVAYYGGNVMGYPLDTLGLTASLRDRIVSPLSLGIITNGRGVVDLAGSVDLQGLFPRGFFATPGTIDNLGYHLTVTGKKIPLGKLTPAVSGTAEMAVKIDGRGIRPDSLVANAFVNANVSAFSLKNSLQPFDVAVACSAGFDRSTAQVHRFTGTFGSATVSLDGSCRIPSGAVDADLKVVVPSLDTLLGIAGIDSVFGSAALSARIGGDLKHPQATVDLKADSIVFRALHADAATLDVQLNRDGIVSLDRLLLTSRGSQLKLSGTAHLFDNGRFVPVDRMTFDCALRSPSTDLHDFVDSIGGLVKIDARVKGTAGNLDGNIRCTVTGLAVAGQHISRIDCDALLDGDRLYLQSLSAEIAPGQNLTATGWASIKDSFFVALQVPGIHLNSFKAVSAIDSLDGIISANVEAGGTYKHPSANGTLTLKQLHKGSLPLDEIALDFTLLDNLVEVSGMVGGSLYALYNFESRSFSADLHCKNMSLTPYLALSGRRLSGALTADISASGTTDSLAAISGYCHIARLTLDYDTLRIIETSDLNASADGNRYAISGFHIALATDGALDGSAKGLFTGPHDITVNGTIPLSVVRYVAPDFPDIEGSVAVDASLKGMADANNLKADVKLIDVGMLIPGIEQQLHALNGRIHADRHAVRIESLRGKLDDGFFSINGELKHDNLVPAGMRADLELKNLPVSVPDMVDLVLDGKLRVSGTPHTTLVAGDIVLVDGLYYKDLALNPLGGSGERKRKAFPKEDTAVVPYLGNMRFDVGIQARTPFQVDNNLAQLTIAPDLHLMGTLRQPILSGRANVTEGTITYLNKTFTIDRGVVDFINPYAIEPNIDIEGTIPVHNRTITILLSGTPDNLSFTLTSSDPTLEDQDILSLLVLGRTTTELQNDFQSDSTFQSSQQMVASLVASTFGGDIKKTTGLDILDIETDKETGDTTNRFAVTIGKKLTKRLSTTYRVESVNNEIMQRAAVEYQLLQNLIVTGFQYIQGIYGGELRLTGERR